jgi:hypothetical protein
MHEPRPLRTRNRTSRKGHQESSRTQPRHLLEEQRKILREVALTYRRARRAGKGQNEAVDVAIVEYRRLNPYATGDSFRYAKTRQRAKLAVSGEVNGMITAAINVNPRWFWHRPDA